MPRVSFTNLVFLLVATVVMIWPAVYNGQPLFFPDTTAYIRGADAGVQRLTGISSAWTRSAPPPVPSTDRAPVDSQQPALQPSLSSVASQSVLSGRSVYYGALLYAGHVTSSMWLTAALQALLLVVAIALILRIYGISQKAYLVVALSLTALTPAPWFASFLMPDIFAALTVLSCAILIVAGSDQRPAHRAFWMLLLTFALLCHQSHLLLAAALLGFGLVWHLLLRGQASKQGLAMILGALLMAILGETSFSFGVRQVIGASPIRPPFLMARLVMDGTGYRYLRETCPESGFVICNFVDRMPIASGPFLWNADPARGVFAATDPETRRALTREEYRFVLAVLRHDPLGQVRVSTRNALLLASAIALHDFEYRRGTREVFERSVPSEYLPRMRRSRAYLEAMPNRALSRVSYLSTIAGLIYLIWVFVAPQSRPPTASIAYRLAGFVALGVFANAAICGVLSAAGHRYQARVAWLIPVIALCVDFSRRAPWWNRMFGAVSDPDRLRTDQAVVNARRS